MSPPIRIKKVIQITDTHCGPAVVEMLLAHRGFTVSQNRIVAEARAVRRVVPHGVRPAQLARALNRLAPGYRFWFKQNATAADLNVLINTHKTPVAINWQALFYESVAEEAIHCPKKNRFGDHGHYSVAVGINPSKDTITITDPYPDLAGPPRTYSLDWFVTRWWDYAKDVRPSTGTVTVIKPRHFMFIICPKSARYPKEIGMQPAGNLNVLEVRS